MKKMKRILVLLVGVFLLTGCTKTEEEVEKQIYSVEADLTQDGKAERIEVDVTDILADDQQPAYIRVFDPDGQIIWQTEISLSQDGRASYYLIEKNGQRYLLYYLPEVTEGEGIYAYRLFNLDQQGREQEMGSNRITFSTEPGTAGGKFSRETLEAFADIVNQYLQDGILLVSTVNGNLRYSTTEEQLVDTERYQSLPESKGLSATDDLRENLDVLEAYLNQKTDD